MLKNETSSDWGVLTCPKSHSPLRPCDGMLVCTDPGCRLRFALEEGVPNFLLEEADCLTSDQWSDLVESESATEADRGQAEPSRDQGQYDRKDRYDRLGDTYEEDRYGQKHMRAYLQLRTRVLSDLLDQELAANPEIQLLEVGCGTGVNLEPMVRPGVTAYALDISTTMLQQAADRFRDKPQVIPVKGSAFGLPFADDSLDMLYATRFIHQFPREEKAKIYEELYRVVRPGGLVIVEFYAESLSNLFVRRAKEREFRRAIKFPRAHEVREVIQVPYQVIPLKIAGTNILGKLIGQAGLDRAVGVLGRIGMLKLLTAYFAVSRAPDR